jgi:dolichol-phosphate mannosyltransferase
MSNSSDKQLYSVILPTYNERENLPLMMYLLDKHLTSNDIQYEVIVVEDNSPDGTLEVAKKLQVKYMHVFLRGDAVY